MTGERLIASGRLANCQGKGQNDDARRILGRWAPVPQGHGLLYVGGRWKF